VIPHAAFIGGLEEASRDDLIRVNVIDRQWNDARSKSCKLSHRLDIFLIYDKQLGACFGMAAMRIGFIVFTLVTHASGQHEFPTIQQFRH
jgi:hypothetical protein